MKAFRADVLTHDGKPSSSSRSRRAPYADRGGIVLQVKIEHAHIGVIEIRTRT